MGDDYFNLGLVSCGAAARGGDVNSFFRKHPFLGWTLVVVEYVAIAAVIAGAFKLFGWDAPLMVFFIGGSLFMTAIFVGTMAGLVLMALAALPWRAIRRWFEMADDT